MCCEARTLRSSGRWVLSHQVASVVCAVLVLLVLLVLLVPFHEWSDDNNNMRVTMHSSTPLQPSLLLLLVSQPLCQPPTFLKSPASRSRWASRCAESSLPYWCAVSCAEWCLCEPPSAWPSPAWPLASESPPWRETWPSCLGCEWWCSEADMMFDGRDEACLRPAAVLIYAHGLEIRTGRETPLEHAGRKS